MSEFRFPPLRTNLLKEVSFGLPSQDYDQIPLLPNLLTVPMVTLPNAVTTFSYAIKDDPGKGKVYSWTLTPENNKGLVIVCHGAFNGGNKTEKENAFSTVFDYLCNCLASNGFVVVSVRHTPASGAVVAAADILTNLKFVLTDPDKKFAKFKLPGRPVAFVGLSEGAHGAIIAADRVMKGELGNLLSSVSALVALAPTPTAKFSNFANSLLILQGTHDGDTPAGGQSMLVYEACMVPEKYFLWIHGASHAGFLQGTFLFGDTQLKNVSESDKSKGINNQTQRFVTQNYVTMFLLGKVAKVPMFDPVFVGDRDVEWTHPNETIKGDILSKRFRALPLYDKMTLIPLDLELKADAMFQGLTLIDKEHPLKVKALRDLLFTLRNHGVQGCVVEWIRKNHPLPKLTAICNKDVMKMLPPVIEFQAIVTAGAGLNSSNNKAATISVRLRSAGKDSAPVSAIIERSIVLNAEQKAFNLNVTRSILSTIRIPVSKFGVLPPGFLASADLVLDFSTPETAIGQVAIAHFRASFA